MPLLALLVAVPAPLASAQVAFNVAGATFPAPLYSKWFDEYAKKTGVQVNYQAIGSGGGIKAITDKTVDFGASDGILTAEQQSVAPDVLHIPTTMGSDVLAYNVSGVESGLKLTPETLAGIFLGTITKWNDPALAGDNPTLSLPDKDIITVHRSDGSGTTYIFTNYLTKVSPEWASQVGNATSVNWPNGLGGQGNAGVAGEIKANDGAIGYVELAYAIQNKITYATMKNASGNWVDASIASTSAAADGVTLPDDMKIMVTNSSNANAYPIASFTWILANQNQADSAKGKALVDLLNWAVTDGQVFSADLNYAPLPPSAVTKAQALITSIKY
ncbi:MAG: phosphate ABC transporter substrate-binding protein PstS [Chloroflexi bacterium]|nr:phosphate ABC transporter substrate-binding protein PstS [Chloroflexota bacterium]